MFVTLSDTKENGLKIFVIVKTAVFWNVCFYRPLRSHKNHLISCTKNVKKPCGPLWNVPWHFLCWIIWESLSQKFIFTEKIDLFSKLSVFNNLLVPKTCWYNFQSNCQSNFWTVINCFAMFVTLDGTRNYGPKTFSIVKTATFWNDCFYRPLRSQRNVHVICTISVKIPCGPL